MLDSCVIITDDENALYHNLYAVFFNSSCFLCMWHINKNVLSYIKKISLLKKKKNFEKIMQY